MKNVYDDVSRFYESEEQQEPIVQQDWVEGYLRQKAWQGLSDDDLRQNWHYIRAFADYLDVNGTYYEYDLGEFPCHEYGLALQWMSKNGPAFRLNLKTVRSFFEVLQDFYRYLESRGLISGYEELERAALEIPGGKRLNLFPPSLHPDREVSEDPKGGESEGSHPMEAVAMGRAIERLMARLGSYFQQREFTNDFHRALLLFNGPINSIPAEENGHFWMRFWDYFLFDYHLIASDDTPLAHFQKKYKSKLSAEERTILQELLSARFCVFYVDQVVNHDWIDCVHLFTEERFRLPHPQLHHKNVKKMLFFGHVFSRENMMVNYMTTLEISPILRRRIKEEVTRQKALYNVQEPAGDWKDMLSRHALIVRHTIDLLSSMAKVIVTPFHQIDRNYPVIKKGLLSGAAFETLTMILERMPDYTYSLHDTRLAGRMWTDFSNLTELKVRKPELWAASVIYTFSQINGIRLISADRLATDFGVSAGSIYSNRTKIMELLELQQYDPRYINEEGFLLSLFDMA